MSVKFNDLITTLQNMFPQRVGLCEPELNGNELKYLKECIETGWVSTAGKFVTQFESKLKEITGAKYAIATNTGTSALHALYLASGIEENDEVLTQSLTFVATVNAISYCGATPHFVDISDDDTLTIDTEKLDKYLHAHTVMKNQNCYNKKTGRRIKALVVMHTFGKSTRLKECLDICAKYGLILLEDAAEALGTTYLGEHVGCYGLGGALSFNGNKITTCGGGGAVITNDKSLAEKVRHLSTTAKKTHPYLYVHDQVGYNYRMPNINAAVGLAQLERLGEILNKKKKLWELYQLKLGEVNGVKLLGDESWTQSNNWLVTCRLIDGTQAQLLETLKTLNDVGVGVRPIWTPMHKLQPFMHAPKSDLIMTEKLENEVINLPSSSFLAV